MNHLIQIDKEENYAAVWQHRKITVRHKQAQLEWGIPIDSSDHQRTTVDRQPLFQK